MVASNDQTSTDEDPSPTPEIVVTFQEKLKYDEHADRLYAPKRSVQQIYDENSTPTKAKKKRKSLSFQETVQVLPIPMRTEYSDRERATMWSSAVELQENAARNAVEFASEGYVCNRASICVFGREVSKPISPLTNLVFLILYLLERWDWRNVLEDDRMWYCPATSQFIHPCHCQKFCQH